MSRKPQMERIVAMSIHNSYRSPVSALKSRGNLKTKATTLSVIHKDSESVHCYVRFQGEDCNLTLRFDRGSKAVLCGYPQEWFIHDVEVEAYNSESPKGADMFECDALLDGAIYVSADDEAEILEMLKRAVIKQFNNPHWADCCPTKRRRASILNKIQRAINSLQGGAR